MTGRVTLGPRKGSRTMAVYALLRAAAERGEPCPTNMALAAAVGVGSTGSVGNALRTLADNGLIEVERCGGAKRRVRICETGAATAPTAEVVSTARRRAGEAADQVLAIVACAADHGAPCPSNKSIAARMGWSSGSAVSRALDRLEGLGLIRASRPTCGGRRVTIVETGRTTAETQPLRKRQPAPKKVRALRPGKIAAQALGRIEARAPGRVRGTGSIGAMRPLDDSGGRIDRCQWIHGEPAGRDFCGKPTVPGTSWCAEHKKVVFLNSAKDRDGHGENGAGVARRSGGPRPNHSNTSTAA